MIEAGDEAGSHRIGAKRENDRYLRGRRFGSARCWHGVERDDERHPALN